MEEHELGELKVEISCAHLSKHHRTHTCTQIHLGHGLSEIAGKAWHVGGGSILIDSLINTSFSFDKDIIRNTLIASIIARAVDTVVKTFLTIFHISGRVDHTKVIDRTLVKTLYLVQRIRRGTVDTYWCSICIITRDAIDTIVWYAIAVDHRVGWLAFCAVERVTTVHTISRACGAICVVWGCCCFVVVYRALCYACGCCWGVVEEDKILWTVLTWSRVNALLAVLLAWLTMHLAVAVVKWRTRIDTTVTGSINKKGLGWFALFTCGVICTYFTSVQTRLAECCLGILEVIIWTVEKTLSDLTISGVDHAVVWTDALLALSCSTIGAVTKRTGLTRTINSSSIIPRGTSLVTVGVEHVIAGKTNCACWIVCTNGTILLAAHTFVSLSGIDHLICLLGAGGQTLVIKQEVWDDAFLAICHTCAWYTQLNTFLATGCWSLREVVLRTGQCAACHHIWPRRYKGVVIGRTLVAFCRVTCLTVGKGTCHTGGGRRSGVSIQVTAITALAWASIVRIVDVSCCACRAIGCRMSACQAWILAFSTGI